MRRQRHAWFVALLVVVAVLVAGCAAGANPEQGQGPDAAGFWLGLWHGLISPVTFIISLFKDDVNIYEVMNNGNWYDFGFVLGVSIVFSGSSGSAAGASRRR